MATTGGPEKKGHKMKSKGYKAPNTSKDIPMKKEAFKIGGQVRGNSMIQYDPEGNKVKTKTKKDGSTKVVTKISKENRSAPGFTGKKRYVDKY